MDENTIKAIFYDAGFQSKINLSSYNDNRVDMDITCSINTDDDIKRFICFYEKHTNETIKVKTKKKYSDKSIYRHWISYRCHHNTRYSIVFIKVLLANNNKTISISI